MLKIREKQGLSILAEDESHMVPQEIFVILGFLRKYFHKV